MKRIFLILTLMVSVIHGADTQSSAKFVVTGIPLDGDTFTFQGVMRTWKTTVTSAGTQVQIGASALISANNMMTQISAYPLNSTCTPVQQSSLTNIVILEKANTAVTASRSGTWATVTVNTSSLTQRGLSFPFVTESTVTRTNDANDLVAAFSYATSLFGANIAALGNFVNTSLAQNIGGAKVFYGANTYSNIAQLFWGGSITNILKADIGTNNVGGLVVTNYALFIANPKITNETPTVEFWESDSSTDNRRGQFFMGGSGLNIKFLKDDGSASSNVFSIDRTSGYGAAEAIFRTRLTADYIYNTTLSNWLSTNGVFLHTAVAQIGSLMGTGNFAISNTSPILTLHDTDAASGSQKFLLKANANQLELAFADDTGAIPLSPSGDIFKVSRTHGTDATGETLNFYPAVQFNSAVSFLTGDIVGALARLGTGLILGTGAGTTLPSGASQALMFAPGAGPSGTPSGYTLMWSSGGEQFYQSGASGEGDSAANRIHNRTATVLGAGTDYSLTSSTAFVDFGTTDPKVTLPTDGTYLIWAEEAITAGGTANDDYRAKLRNETASTDISGSDQAMTNLGAGFTGTIRMQATATATAGNVIAIWSHNNTAARGTVNSARTRIGYVRLY